MQEGLMKTLFAISRNWRTSKWICCKIQSKFLQCKILTECNIHRCLRIPRLHLLPLTFNTNVHSLPNYLLLAQIWTIEYWRLPVTHCIVGTYSHFDMHIRRNKVTNFAYVLGKVQNFCIYIDLSHYWIGIGLTMNIHWYCGRLRNFNDAEHDSHFVHTSRSYRMKVQKNDWLWDAEFWQSKPMKRGVQCSNYLLIPHLRNLPNINEFA